MADREASASASNSGANMASDYEDRGEDEDEEMEMDGVELGVGGVVVSQQKQSSIVSQLEFKECCDGVIQDAGGLLGMALTN